LNQAMGGNKARIYLVSSAVGDNPNGLLATVQGELIRTAKKFSAITAHNYTRSLSEIDLA